MRRRRPTAKSLTSQLSDSAIPQLLNSPFSRLPRAKLLACLHLLFLFRLAWLLCFSVSYVLIINMSMVQQLHCLRRLSPLFQRQMETSRAPFTTSWLYIRTINLLENGEHEYRNVPCTGQGHTSLCPPHLLQARWRPVAGSLVASLTWRHISQSLNLIP